jgi:hypothetical protein
MEVPNERHPNSMSLVRAPTFMNTPVMTWVVNPVLPSLAK